MSPSSAAGGTGGAADTLYGSGALATLYPTCLGCRQQVDSLLASIDNSAVYGAGRAPTSSVGAVGPSSSARSASSPAWPSGSVATDVTCGGGNVATQQRLLGLSQQLSRDVARLCDAFERERPQLSQQQVLLWQRRVTGLREDAASLANSVQAELGSMQWRVQDEQQKQRDELLQLRGSRGRSRHGSSRGRSAAAVDKEERAAARLWDHERREEHAAELAWLREREKLQESGMMLETIFAQGRGVLDRVVQQNSVLRNARRKLMKLTSAAGVSSTLIRAAARRQASDRRLVYTGMVLTLVFFFLLYRLAQSYSLSSLFWMGALRADPTTVGPDVIETVVAEMPQAMRR